MGRSWIIARRDLASFFDGPMAYILLTVFLGAWGFFTWWYGAWYPDVFVQGQADLMPFFQSAYWTLFVFSAGIGCVPSVGAMIRARWAALYRGTPQLHTAYSFESVVDEVCFIFGPIISIGLSTAWFPEAGPLLAAGFLAAGVFWLTAQRATEPAPHPREQHGRRGNSALRSAGLQVLVATFVATGAIFGAVDVVAMPTSPTPAFKIGERSADPLQMYLADVFTVSANLAGLPAVSIPCGFSADRLPIGLQLTGRAFDEATLLRVADAYERDTSWWSERPDLRKN